MPGITLEMAQAKLALWLEAESALAGNQSYTIAADGSSRTLTRADLADVAKRIDYWNGKVKTLEARSFGRSRTRYMVR